ncbi:MAG: hypothetical protein ABSA07_03260 [Acidimicrobiales bacterium]|jgi:hypothetical protein
MVGREDVLQQVFINDDNNNNDDDDDNNNNDDDDDDDVFDLKDLNDLCELAVANAMVGL